MLFISYSTKDRRIASEIYERLTARGYHSPFLDYHPESGIPGGSKWEEELHWQMRLARGLVVLCSNNWMDSKWCFAELDRAKELRKVIIPLNLDKLTLPENISAFQAIPFHNRDDEAYTRLWKALEHAKLNPGDDFFWPRDACPYPGLSAFDEEHAGVYFGRDKELTAFFAKCLKPMRETGDPRLIYVIGPSGSGKSSFVKAGVLPRLKFKSGNQWQVLAVFRWADLRRHGQSWGERLAHEIQRLYGEHPNRPAWDAEQIATRYAVSKDPASIREAAEKFIFDVKDFLVAADGTTPLIILDQFEELLVPSDGQDDFLQFLRYCLGADDSPCRAIATVRSDFLPAIQEHPALVAWNDRTQLFRLDLLRNERLFDIVRRPAEVVDVRFEDDSLVNRIVGEAETSDALPLLAFTLQQFYSSSTDEDDRLLSTSEYDKLGGLKQCLQTVAAEVLVDNTRPSGNVDPAEEEALRVSFVKHLVRYQHGGDEKRDAFVKQTASWSAIPEAARPLLLKMSSEEFRLVRIDRHGDSPTTVEVTHEALFRNWDKLARWLDQRRDYLRWRTDVERARAAAGDQWSGLSGTQLAVARDWPNLRPNELSEDEIAWISSARFRIRFIWASVATAAATIVIVAAIAIGFFRESKTERGLRTAAQESDARSTLGEHQAALQSDGTRASFLAGVPGRNMDSLRVAVRAIGAAEKPPESVETALTRLRAERSTPPPEAQEGLAAAIASMRSSLALDNTEGHFKFATFSPDETEVLTIHSNGRVEVWEIATGKRITTLGKKVGESMDVARATFSLDGQEISTVDTQGTIKIWDATTGDHKRDVARLDSESIISLEYLAATEPILMVATAKKIHSWSAATFEPIEPFAASGKFESVSFAYGKIVAVETDSDSKRIRSWVTKTWEPGTGFDDCPDWLAAATRHTPGAVMSVIAQGRAAEWLEKSTLFSIPLGSEELLDSREISSDLRAAFEQHERPLTGEASVTVLQQGRRWRVYDSDKRYGVKKTDALVVSRMMDWKIDDEPATLIAAVVIQGTPRVLIKKSQDLYDGRLALHDPVSGDRVSDLRGHTRRINSVVYSQAKRRFLTVSFDRTARVWDARSGALIAELKGHDGDVIQGAFAPSGNQLVTTSSSYFKQTGTARIWNLQPTQAMTEIRPDQRGAIHAAFSPDLKRIATWSDRFLLTCLFDFDPSALHSTMSRKHAVGKVISPSILDCAFAPNGRYLATLSSSGKLTILKTSDLKRQAFGSGHQGQSISSHLTFSPDSQSILTVADDDVPRLWDVESGDQLHEFSDVGQMKTPWPASFSHDGRLVATADKWSNEATVWDTQTGKVHLRLKGHKFGLMAVSFCPCDDRIVTSSLDTTAKIWNGRTGELLHTLEGHRDAIWRAEFCPDGKYVVTAGEDSTPRLWNASSGDQIATLIGHSDWVISAHFSPHGERIVTAGQDGTARLWEVPSGKPLGTLLGNSKPLTDAQFSSDGKWVLTGSADGTAMVFPATYQGFMRIAAAYLRNQHDFKDIRKFCESYIRKP